LNHRNLRSILDDVQSIAIVGASSNPRRDSYKVMKFLQDYGFDIFPVNPNLANTKILGQKCYKNLEAIEEKIDMVDVFRAIEHIPSITL
jgi:predicted CoA-binding protein